MRGQTEGWDPDPDLEELLIVLGKDFVSMNVIGPVTAVYKLFFFSIAGNINWNRKLGSTVLLCSQNYTSLSSTPF